LFDRFFAGRSIAVRNLAGNPAPATSRIPLDIVQNKDELVVTASVPGTAKEDIEISVDDNVLMIQVEANNSLTIEESETFLLQERRTGSYYRALRLPDMFDCDGAESTLKAGVLTIRLPKLESKKVRKLEITAA
jgi:HSP20 family protein